jgi:hypothetical protein
MGNRPGDVVSIQSPVERDGFAKALCILATDLLNLPFGRAFRGKNPSQGQLPCLQHLLFNPSLGVISRQTQCALRLQRRISHLSEEIFALRQ